MESNQAWPFTLVTGVFLLLTAIFLLDPAPVHIPVPPPAVVSAQDISGTPLRTAMTDPPTVYLGGFDRDCMDCHQIFKGRRYQDRLYQHRHIDMKHGEALQGQCLTCHSRTDRNRLALHGDNTASFAEVSQLCGKCHGPALHDWERGMHGRTTGSWDASSGKQRRLVCTECHDPHQPRYKPLAPLPGPNTLRMGERKPHETHYDSPLMRGTP